MQSAKGKFLLSSGILLIVIVFFLTTLPIGIRKMVNGEKSRAIILQPIFQTRAEEVVGFDVHGKGEHVALTSTSQGWYFTYPAGARANTSAVSTFLHLLCRWTPERQCKVIKSSEAEDVFGWQKQPTIYTLYRTDGKTIRVITGGFEPESGYIYAKKEDSASVFLLKEIKNLKITGLAYRLRDHNLFPTPLTNITRISFREGRSVITLITDEPLLKTRSMPIFGSARQVTVSTQSTTNLRTWSIIYPHQFPAEPQTVELILAMISQWEVQNFVEETVGTRSNLSRYGLINPEVELTIHSGRQRCPLHISFGLPHGSKGPVYMKTSQHSQIVEIDPKKLDILQDLFSHVCSRRLVYFLEQVGRLEILISQWKVTVLREKEYWEASLQQRISYMKEHLSKEIYQQKKTAYLFPGESIIELLKDWEYLDILTATNPFYKDYKNSSMVMKIIFIQSNGKKLNVFTLWRGNASAEIIFLNRELDDKIYLVSNSIYTDIMGEIENELIHNHTVE